MESIDLKNVDFSYSNKAKLLFRVKEANYKDGAVIYSEDTLRGVYQVCENVMHEDSKLDSEGKTAYNLGEFCPNYRLDTLTWRVFE
jgi:hypothetical protein